MLAAGNIRHRGNPELRNYIARRLEANNCGDCHLSTMMDKDKVKPPPARVSTRFRVLRRVAVLRGGLGHRGT